MDQLRRTALLGKIFSFLSAVMAMLIFTNNYQGMKKIYQALFLRIDFRYSKTDFVII